MEDEIIYLGYKCAVLQILPVTINVPLFALLSTNIQETSTTVTPAAKIFQTDYIGKEWQSTNMGWSTK